MDNYEVLAPVGSFKNLKVAINSGADAVYFGVKNFNARQKAENVDLEQLPDFVKLAHLHNVKTYMTLNTLIKNDEFDDVLKVVDCAVESKVDAFIVQDIGLATFLLAHYKNIVLHASTQMGIHNLDGAKFLEDLGFKRVVLSRETKLEDIKNIKNNTNLEIEYFVQGALCVAFSGNCYFSSLMFGESGNRGRCLQPCRMFYEAFQNDRKIKDGYLLSPKDICLIKQIEELKQSGVTSFKIEGRLRRESYLAQAVSTYSKAVQGKVNIDEEIKKLKKVFSRGDYNYGNYLTGTDNIIDSVNSNHRGEKIGVVKNFYPFKDLYKIEMTLTKDLSTGDGIKIVSGDNELSLGVGNVELLKNGNTIIYTKHKPLKGDVYLSVDSKYEEKLIPKDKKLPLEISIIGKVSSPLKVELKYMDNVVNFESDFILEMAKNQPVKIEDFQQIFSRIKDTEFEIQKINVDIDNIFVAKSIINKIKNECILKMEKQILENVNKSIENVIKVGVSDKNYGCIDKLVDNNVNFIYLHKMVKNEEKRIIYSPEIYNQQNIETFLSMNEDKILYLNLPIFATGEEVKIIDDILLNVGKDSVGIVANNYWHLKYLKLGFNTIIGYNMNVINDKSKCFYANLGVDNFIRSIESSLVNNLKGGLAFCGYPVLMTWCHCPYKVSCNSKCEKCTFDNKLHYRLNDGKVFKIRRYKIKNCYFELVSTKKIDSKSAYKIEEIV